MQRVLVPPVLEGNEGEQTCNGTDNLIGPPRGEERAVRAVVHEDKRPHEQSGRGEGEDERPPEGEREQAIHRREDESERQQRRRELEHGATELRGLISRDERTPGTGVGDHDGGDVSHRLAPGPRYAGVARSAEDLGRSNRVRSALVRRLAVVQCGIPRTAVSMRAIAW